jgi:hypothetical protein
MHRPGDRRVERVVRIDLRRPAIEAVEEAVIEFYIRIKHGTR